MHAAGAPASSSSAVGTQNSDEEQAAQQEVGWAEKIIDEIPQKQE